MIVLKGDSKMKILFPSVVLFSAIGLIAAAPFSPLSQTGQPVTPEMIAAVAGVLLSLAASYLPGFSSWFDGLASDDRRRVMLGVLFVVALALFGIGCAGWQDQFNVAVQCSVDGAFELFWAFFYAVTANQVTYALTPKKGIEIRRAQ
jgi:hypothetical protein